MLSRERYEIKVGLVFILTVTCLIAGLLWAKRIRPRQSEMQLVAVFSTVGGLGTGDEVLVNGLRLGKVEAIRLRQRDVLVTLTLDRRIPLYQGYNIRIVTLNFTGEMGVSIEPGAGEPLPEPYGVLRGTDPFSLEDVVQPGLETIRSVRSVAETLSISLPPLVHDARNVLNRLDSTLEEARSGVAVNKVALRRSLDDLQRVLGSANRTISSLETRLDTSLTRADDAFLTIKTASDSLRRAAETIAQAKGTINRLVHDPSLYEDLRRTSLHLDSAAVSIDSLAQDVRRNPKRYVRFSLF